jgi:putative sterol carrier protein
MSASVADFFAKIEKAAQADPAAATAPDAVFKFDISGDGGGTYVLNLKKGTTSGFVSTDSSEAAGATIQVSAEDWVSMLTGQLNPMMAFMSGKVKIDGDTTLAMGLQNVLKLAQ